MNGRNATLVVDAAAAVAVTSAKLTEDSLKNDARGRIVNQDRR